MLLYPLVKLIIMNSIFFYQVFEGGFIEIRQA